MTEQLFTLPENAVASTTAYIGSLISSLSPFIFLVVGILLALIIMEAIVGLIRG